jgi:hypothetical protein
VVDAERCNLIESSDQIMELMRGEVT